MKNLVIGSSGFIGSHLSQYLISLGEEVVPFDVGLDIMQDACFSTLPICDVDRVYFLAWNTGGSKYLYQPEHRAEILCSSARLLLNVMPQLDKAKVPFVFVSSLLAEDCSYAYGVSKRFGELWTDSIGGTTVRLWNPYGRISNVSARSHVITDFVVQALTTGNIRMRTKGLERRQFLFIDDVCSALRAAIDSPNGVYDASTHKWNSIMEVAQIIASLTNAQVIMGKEDGQDFPCVEKPIIPNWAPTISLTEGLKETVASAKKLF